MSARPTDDLRDAAWLWRTMREEGADQGRGEPMLASFFHISLLNHPSYASALAFMLASKLGNDDVGPMLVRQACEEIYAADAGVVEAAVADLCAHYDRDPACTSYLMPFLYFKGFHAVQAQRLAHALWCNGRRGLALFLQNRSATVFDVDIHPAARLGTGLMLDHATGVVIGETAVVGDDVSLLHGVTLGGSGVLAGPRHPQVGNGVLIAAGAQLLGPIRIGDGAKIAAGSVVLDDVPSHTTVAGVPARAVGRPDAIRPSLEMDQGLHEG